MLSLLLSSKYHHANPGSLSPRVHEVERHPYSSPERHLNDRNDLWASGDGTGALEFAFAFGFGFAFRFAPGPEVPVPAALFMSRPRLAFGVSAQNAQM